jgi:hypothetical protein
MKGGRKIRARFGAAPLRPCPSGSLPTANTGYAARPQNAIPAPLKTPSQRDILYTSNTVEQGPKVLLILHRQLSKDGGSLI